MPKWIQKLASVPCQLLGAYTAARVGPALSSISPSSWDVHSCSTFPRVLAEEPPGMGGPACLSGVGGENVPHFAAGLGVEMGWQSGHWLLVMERRAASPWSGGQRERDTWDKGGGQEGLGKSESKTQPGLKQTLGCPEIQEAFLEEDTPVTSPCLRNPRPVGPRELGWN